MKIKFASLLLYLLVGVAQASDGELGWTSMSFCNAADYCVDLVSMKGIGLDSIHIKRNGEAIDLPARLLNQNQIPVLNEVRLINVLRTDGVSENRLEIPFLMSQRDAKQIRQVLNILILDDNYSKTYITR